MFCNFYSISSAFNVSSVGAASHQIYTRFWTHVAKITVSNLLLLGLAEYLFLTKTRLLPAAKISYPLWPQQPF